jgi:hypothetical protein
VIILSRRSSEEDAKLFELIDILSISYREHKRMLDELDNGYRSMDYQREKNSRKVCYRFEGVIANMSQEIRLILEAEVLGNKKGTKWYREYYSVSQYYVKRKIAYRKFIEAINK